MGRKAKYTKEQKVQAYVDYLSEKICRTNKY